MPPIDRATLLYYRQMDVGNWMFLRPITLWIAPKSTAGIDKNRLLSVDFAWSVIPANAKQGNCHDYANSKKYRLGN